MFSNILTSDSLVSSDRSIKSFYQKFQHFLGRSADSNSDKINDDMSQREGTIASDDTFMTPVSSTGDLITLCHEGSNDTMLLKKCKDCANDLSIDPDSDIDIKDITTTDMLTDANNFDYILQYPESKQNPIHLDRSKENLFVKLNPLYTRRKLEDTRSDQSDSHLAVDSSEYDVGYETGSTLSVRTDNQLLTSEHSLSISSVSFHNKDRPMQVVPPVINYEMPKSISIIKSTPVLVRSASAILTPTQEATDKLINLSDNTLSTAAQTSLRRKTHNLNVNYISQGSDRLQSLRLIIQKQDEEILQLRQDKRELQNLLQDAEYKCSILEEDLETKVKKFTNERDNFLQKENKLEQKISDKNLCNRQMSIVMEEYENTISSLIDEQQRDKIINQEIMEKITAERDDALSHLENMESSFGDLLAKYEKCKYVILEMKEREKTYGQKLLEYQTAINKHEELYKNLKQVTADALTKANETLDNLKKSYNIDITKLNATVKKHEVTIASLQESLCQKTKDNEELMRLYDQLISEVR